MRVCGVQEGEEEEGESGEEGAAPGGSDAEDGTKYVPFPFLSYPVVRVFAPFNNLLSVRWLFSFDHLLLSVCVVF
jgi:hypothetical protein